MAEYGPGHTIGTAAELDKERVVRALAGEIVCGEDENGFVYGPASKQECGRCILEVVDGLVHQCKELAASGRAMERILEENGGMGRHFQTYLAYFAEESGRFLDYVFEYEKADLLEEAARVAGEGEEKG